MREAIVSAVTKKEKNKNKKKHEENAVTGRGLQGVVTAQSAERQEMV